MAGYTKRQRQILLLMYEHDFARFQGGTRQFHYHTFMEGNRKAVGIAAYQDPEMFLERRGLIKREDAQLPRKYCLTQKGTLVAERMLAYGVEI